MDFEDPDSGDEPPCCGGHVNLDADFSPDDVSQASCNEDDGQVLEPLLEDIDFARKASLNTYYFRRAGPPCDNYIRVRGFFEVGYSIDEINDYFSPLEVQVDVLLDTVVLRPHSFAYAQLLLADIRSEFAELVDNETTVDYLNGSDYLLSTTIDSSCGNPSGPSCPVCPDALHWNADSLTSLLRALLVPILTKASLAPTALEESMVPTMTLGAARWWPLAQVSKSDFHATA